MNLFLSIRVPLWVVLIFAVCLLAARLQIVTAKSDISMLKSDVSALEQSLSGKSAELAGAKTQLTNEVNICRQQLANRTAISNILKPAKVNPIPVIQINNDDSTLQQPVTEPAEPVIGNEVSTEVINFINMHLQGDLYE